MHLKRQVKAGILLYALFMLAIFALLVQFYLEGQKGTRDLYRTSQEQHTAYLMATLVKDTVLGEEKAQKQEQAHQENQLATKDQQDKVQTEQMEQTKEEKSAKPPVISEGHLSFKQGTASYKNKESQLSVTVELSSGARYAYQFSMTSEKP